MAKKKKIRRTVGKKANTNKPKRYYFTKDTQLAIKEFCTSEDHKEKEVIYESRIQPALLKLTENLIYIYGFHKCGESPAFLQQACVVALYECLHKFDHSRGTNAFSYFNIVAKNWLIINSRKIRKRTFSSVSLDDHESMNSVDMATVASYQVVPDPVEMSIYKESLMQIRPLCLEILSELTHKNDVSCMNAIITVFDNIDQLEFLNKRGIFVYIREISGLNSKQLSSSMTNIRRKYRGKVGKDKKYDLF
jgi:hypothetical protein